MTRSPDPDKPAARSAAMQGKSLAFLVGAGDAGARLDKWLSERGGGLTRSRIKALIEAGALAREGERFVDPSYKIREGERFTLTPPPVVSATPKPEAIPLDVVYEDADIIVVDKPAGMVTHPAAGNWTGTLVNALIAHCGESLSGVGGEARPGIVHRLDKDTSGLIVAAKHDRAHLALRKAFSERDIERVYDAIVTGAPRPSVGVIDAPLARAGSDRKKMTVVSNDANRPGARRAVTRYRIVEAFGHGRAKLPGDGLASLIECRLETGRTHQIRAHMAHLGHPLVGDPVYGRGPGLAGLKPGDPASDAVIAILKCFRRQALHARVLGFAHPISGAVLSFEAPPPADLQELIPALRAL